MAQFEKRFVQDLTQDIKIQQGGTIVFNNDNLSNVVGVALYNGKVPASVSGTVVGAVIAPDGATVPVDNGTISGNTVSITLTRACFALPGNIGVGIQVVTGDVATTVLKVIYNVELFSTDTIVDPDSRITLSLAEIQAKLDEIPTILANAQTAIDGIEAQKDTMIASIASVAGQGTDTTLTQSGVAADAKATGDQVRDLKSAVGVNLAGTSIGHLYPVHILNGSKITISTSDGSTFNSTVKLHYWGLNKNHVGQWAFGSSYGNSRTVTAGYDIYWLSFEWQDASTFGVETGETMSTPYMVNFGTSAESYQAWFEQPQVFALRQDMNAVADTNFANNSYRNDYDGGFFSLNANYFDADTAIWTDGLVATATGSVTQTSEYEFAFVPLRGAGTYITQINSNSYGANARKLALYDANKNFIKSIDADSYSGNNQKYTLTAADAKTAVYTILQRKKTESTIPKLFYNSIFTDVTNFQIDAGIPFAPKYGVISDVLYKATVVCDGDSICEGGLDNPYQWHGWFGRIVRNYQASGKDYAVGGGTITDMTNTTVGGNPRHSVAISIDTIVSEYPELDYLILEGGTNDADLIGAFDGATAPEGFGTWDADSMSADYIAALDKTTFCGAVEYIFYKAMVSYPNAKIGFIVPMSMGIYTNQKTNRKRYFDEIIKIAAKWGIPVLNLWDTLHVRANFDAYYDRSKTAAENVTAKKFYNDGQHPTSYGYNLMQPMIEAWLKML